MPDEVLTIVNAVSGLGFTGLVIVLAVPKLKKLVFGNGTKEITNNHLPHLETKMDKIIELISEQNEKSAERHGEIMGAIK